MACGHAQMDGSAVFHARSIYLTLLAVIGFELDISQTIIDGFFNMMMIVDYSGADNEFGVIVEDLDKLGEQIGVRIRCQREEIFTKMHRV